MEKLYLKPCPFCGGEAVSNAEQRNGYSGSVIRCSRCGVKSPWIKISTEYASTLRAAEIWNNRSEADGKEKDVILNNDILQMFLMNYFDSNGRSISVNDYRPVDPLYKSILAGRVGVIIATKNDDRILYCPGDCTIDKYKKAFDRKEN